jgi:hypothetical protein
MAVKPWRRVHREIGGVIRETLRFGWQFVYDAGRYGADGRMLNEVAPFSRGCEEKDRAVREPTYPLFILPASNLPSHCSTHHWPAIAPAFDSFMKRTLRRECRAMDYLFIFVSVTKE